MSERKFYPPKCMFTVQDGYVKTDGSIRGKVTGTMMAAILGKSPFATPFSVACDLLGVATEDISDKPAVKAGRALEAKVIEHLNTLDMGIRFYPAEDVFEARVGDHSKWPSDFDNDVFAGHVDGIAIDHEGEDFILEVKTSANWGSWLEGVPVYYKWQVALYDHFMTKRGRAYVALGLVTEDDQKHPENWMASENTVSLMNLEFDEAEVEEGIQKIVNWYIEHIMRGVTPCYDPTNPKDVAIINHLTSISQEEEGVRETIDRLAEVRMEIKAAESQMKSYYDEEKELIQSIKDYMITNERHAIPSTDGGWIGVVTISERRSVSAELLAQDGIDPDRYTVTKTVSTFNLRKGDKDREE